MSDAQLPNSIQVWVCPRCGTTERGPGTDPACWCTVPTTAMVRYRYVLAEVTDEMRERVMEAVAAEFGSCSNVTADRIIAAAFSTSHVPEEGHHG